MSNEVGSECTQSGTYLHTGCYTQKAHFDTGDTFAPCQNDECPNRGADWMFVSAE